MLVCFFGYYVICNMGMGFCLFNNVAIVVYYVLIRLGVEWVVILDWDVYYGNGIEVLVDYNFWIFYCFLY